MYDVRRPPELLDRLQDSARKENRTLSVVFEEFPVLVAVDLLAVEIVFVVNEIHLHPGSGYGSNLYHKRPVYIVDDYVHSREADDFMQLVLPLVDAAESRHE